MSRSLGKNDKDSFGHLDVCISIMDLLSCSVLRLSINSYSTSVRHRANVDNGVSILLTKRVSQVPVNITIKYNSRKADCSFFYSRVFQIIFCILPFQEGPKIEHWYV